MRRFKIRDIVVSGIILLLAWISFIPKLPLQYNYQTFISIFLIGLLAISIIRKRFRVKLIFSKEDIGLWLNAPVGSLFLHR